MKKMIPLLLFSICMSCSYSQKTDESKTSYTAEVKYKFQEIVTEDEFKLMEQNLLSRHKYDSTTVETHIDELRHKQQVLIDSDTSEICNVYVIGEPFDFDFSFDGSQESFYKKDFSQRVVLDDYSHHEYWCLVGSYTRSEQVISTNIRSHNLDVNCQINLSYSTIKIEDNRTLSLLDSVNYVGTNQNNLPIPNSGTVATMDFILVNHTNYE